MNNPFFEKGMEMLEHGQQAVKQQVNTTKQSAVGQVTGQQPNAQQNGQPQPLDSFKEQVLGVPQQTQLRLDSVHDQLLGESKPAGPTEGLQQQIMGGGEAPKSSASTEAQQMQQKAQNDFMDAMYGPSNPEQPALDQQAIAEKAQQDQKQQQEKRALLQNYFQPEIEQKMAQLRQERTQEKVQEEKQEEEEKKMEELQKEEEKKKPVNPTQKTAENKAAGAG